MYICGEHLPRMSHLLRNPTDIITQSSGQLNGLIHMKVTLLRMLSLLRSTANNNNNRLNVTPHRSYRHSTGNLFRAPYPFRAGRTFRADPRLSGNPQTHPPGYSFYGLPLAIPERLITRLPRRGGYPLTRGGGGGCHSSLRSSGDISIPHSGVSRGHRNVPHASDSHYTTSPDSSGLRRPPSRTLLL